MAAPATGFRAFVIVWGGQFVSMVGSNATGFALGVYVFQKTGSVTLLGIVLALGILPWVMLSPLAGSLVDRWGSRRSLLVANSGNLILTFIMAVLLLTNTFAVWHVYVVGIVAALLTALEVPAFGAVMPNLVTKQNLGRANGLRMFATAVSQTAAPLVGGFLMVAFGLQGVVLADLVTFGVAILTLLFVRIPHARKEADPTTDPDSTLLSEFREGWRYVASRRGLRNLLLFVAGVNFSAGFIDVSVAPLILSFSTASALGTVIAIGGIGMIITSVAMSVLGAPSRRIRAILLLTLVLAVATVLGAARPNVALIATAAFIFLGALGLIVAINQSIWQTKIPAYMMGRVMALANMVALVPQLLGYLLAGLFADRVFKPLVGIDHVRSPALATLIGDGPGRGIALMMMVMGPLIAITVGFAALNPRLRRLEDEVPDVTPEPDSYETEIEPTEDPDDAVAKATPARA